MKKDSALYVLLFTFVCTFVFGCILAVVYGKLRSEIAVNDALAEKRGVLQAFRIAYSDDKSVEERYHQVQKKDGYLVYESPQDGRLYGYQFVGNGLWGKIEGVFVMNEALDRVMGLAFTEQAETPGLGGRISEPWFTEQFHNKPLTDGGLQLNASGGPGNRDTNSSVVDGVSGASITSRFVLEAVRNSVAQLTTLVTKEGS